MRGLAVSLLLGLAACGGGEPDAPLARPETREAGRARSAPAALESGDARAPAEAPRRESVAQPDGPDGPDAPETLRVQVYTRVLHAGELRPGVVRVEAGLRAKRKGKWVDVAEARAAGATGADGRATFAFERPAVGDAGVGFGAWARVVEEGYQGRREETRGRADGVSNLVVGLGAHPGGTARGTVLGVDGEPCGFAQVKLIDVRGDVVEQRPYGDDARCRRDGTFELHFTEDGPFTLVAARPQRGSARMEPLALSAVDPPRDLVVQLAGAGRIAGVVRDGAGRPVANYVVRVVALDARETPKLFTTPAGGLDRGRTKTTSAGAFAFAGLRPGAYRIFGSRGKHGDEERDLLGKPVRTGREDLVLLADQYLVTVRALEPSGAPLPLSSAARRGDVHVTARQCDELGALIRGDAPPWSTSAVEGALTLHALPDVHYLVSGWSSERGLVERQVVVTAGDPLVELDLPFGPARAPAMLVVEPRGPRGQVYVGGYYLEVAGERGRTLTTIEHEAGPERTTEVTLPPGRYRVTVTPPWDEWAADASAWLLEDSGPVPFDFEAVRVVVDLGAGERRSIAPNFTGVGAVRVLVELETESTEAAPRATVIARRAGDERELSFPNGLLEDASEAQSESVVHTAHGRFDLRDGIIPGRAQRSYTYLPGGRWTVRAELEGYAPAEVECEVELDEEVEVHLTLKRK